MSTLRHTARPSQGEQCKFLVFPSPRGRYLGQVQCVSVSNYHAALVDSSSPSSPCTGLPVATTPQCPPDTRINKWNRLRIMANRCHNAGLWTLSLFLHFRFIFRNGFNAMCCEPLTVTLLPTCDDGKVGIPTTWLTCPLPPIRCSVSPGRPPLTREQYYWGPRALSLPLSSLKVLPPLGTWADTYRTTWEIRFSVRQE